MLTAKYLGKLDLLTFFPVAYIMKKLFQIIPADFQFQKDDKSIGLDEVLKINLDRFIYLIYIGLPVTLIHIIIFGFNPENESKTVELWRVGITYSHLLLFFTFLITAIGIRILRKKRLTNLLIVRLSPHFIFLFLLIMGAVIAGFDQLVTKSITPFIIVCLLSAMVLTIPPLLSAIYYLLAYVAFYFLITHFQTNPEALLSNYVNGVTSFIIGWLLSLTFWRNNVQKFTKNRIIDRQQAELEDHNIKLKQIAAELIVANKTKDKLISVVSHDLRGPFATLNELLRYMQSGEISEKEFREMLPELFRQTIMTNDLLENLLRWSYNNLKGAVINTEIFNIKPLADNVIQLYLNQARDKSLNILNSINSEHKVVADKGMIAVVLRNLISNAIKFSKKEGKIVLSSFQENNFITVIIQDNGIGISESKIPLIFSEENYTTSGTAGEKGTGLGLMLCREFVEKNGGIIGVDSKPDIGTRFMFTLPALLNGSVAFT